MKLITIKNMPVKYLDALILLLKGGYPDKETLEGISNAFDVLRQQYEKEHQEKKEQNKTKPNEDLRLTSANPTSVEHK